MEENSIRAFVNQTDVKNFLNNATNQKLINDLVKANRMEQKLENLSVAAKEIFQDSNNNQE